MPTPYSKIYKYVLHEFKDYDIPLMELDEAEEYLFGYLMTAIPKFVICRQDLDDRDDELKQFNIDLTDMEIEIIGNYLVIEYLDSNYIRTPTLLKVSLSSSDFNAFSNANQLDKLITMHKTFLGENESLLMRYSWLNPKKDLSNKRNSLTTGYNPPRTRLNHK